MKESESYTFLASN